MDLRRGSARDHTDDRQLTRAMARGNNAILRWRNRARQRGVRAAAIAVVCAALIAAVAACDTGSGSAAGVGAPGSTGAATETASPQHSVTVPPAARTTSPGPADDARTGDPTPTSPISSVTTSAHPSATPAQTVDAAPAALITTSLTSAAAVNPAKPITVSVADGTLTAVRLTNPKEDVTVTGSLSADHRSWTSSEALGYGKSYQLSAAAVNVDGLSSATNADFTTLTPPNMTMPYFRTIGGSELANGGTFGVGMVVVVHFDEPISDRAAAQKTLHVTTTPHVDGSWYWADSKDVHWRPEKFYPAGTKVTVSADVYGVQVSPGLYGQSDKSVSFTIGREQITYAYDNAPHDVNKVVVKDGAGNVLRTMNTSMGAHSGVTVNGKYINFYTMSGTYTVIGHENPAMMSSASYGLPADAPGGYAPEPVYWSTRISTDGIYLHELDTTVWAQNSGRDVSHGCLNLNRANAQWFYEHSLVGDPVIVDGADGAPAINLWQGGDWSVPWSTWLAGSALT